MNKNTIRLTESAVMLALATVLSLIKFDGPWLFGGSVTLLSMLPIALIAYRYSTGWGLFVGGAYGLIQMLLGLKNLTYATWWGAAVAIVLFDYLVAFGVLGFSGIFKGKLKNQPLELALGVLIGGLLRYACHFVTGVTVWRELADLKAAAWYSLTYNGSYMIPEIIITIIGAVLLSLLLDFTAEPTIRPRKKA